MKTYQIVIKDSKVGPITGWPFADMPGKELNRYLAEKLKTRLSKSIDTNRISIQERD
jgi:hypothetical protein